MNKLEKEIVLKFIRKEYKEELEINKVVDIFYYNDDLIIIQKPTIEELVKHITGININIDPNEGELKDISNMLNDKYKKELEDNGIEDTMVLDGNLVTISSGYIDHLLENLKNCQGCK